MSLTVQENRNFFSIPEGSLIAHGCAVIDLGVQHSKFYKDSLLKVMIGWELIHKFTEAKNHGYIFNALPPHSMLGLLYLRYSKIGGDKVLPQKN